MYRLLLFILPFWFCSVLSLVHLSVLLWFSLNQSFCTFISDYYISNFWSYELFLASLYYSPVVISDRCCSLHLLHVRDLRGILTPFPSFPLQETLLRGAKTNSCIVVHVCVCVRVWIISHSISIPLALDVDRCLQEAASEPHGILDHVGQIYGLMLPLTTRRPTLVTLVRPTGAIYHAMLKASTLLAHLHSWAIDCI